MEKRSITFEIVKHIGVIKEHESGWKRELNIVAWNDNEPKFDIRDWDPRHERMKRGLTFDKSEFEELVELYGIYRSYENEK